MSSIQIVLRDGGWQDGNQAFLFTVTVIPGDSSLHTGVGLDYGDGREPAAISVQGPAGSSYDSGFGIGYSNPDPAPGVTYHVSASDDASLDFTLPAYPSRGVYNVSIGREDVAACIPEDGQRGLGFKG